MFETILGIIISGLLGATAILAYKHPEEMRVPIIVIFAISIPATSFWLGFVLGIILLGDFINDILDFCLKLQGDILILCRDISMRHSYIFMRVANNYIAIFFSSAAWFLYLLILYSLPKIGLAKKKQN
jgi:hypothetical protein